MDDGNVSDTQVVNDDGDIDMYIESESDAGRGWQFIV